MSVYFIGCLHLGHKNMAVWRGFDSVIDHDAKIMNTLYETLTKRDKLYILGDVTMEKPDKYEMLYCLPGVKHVVLGNHDSPKHIEQLIAVVDKVSGPQKYKDAWLSHIPVHPMELGDDGRCTINIHAHIHEKNITKNVWDKDNPGFTKVINDPRYINADAMQLGYKPLQWEDLRRPQ